jgi:PAS domain S-box-containing protein
VDARIGLPDAGRPATVRAAPRRSRWWRRQPGAAPRIAGLYAAIGFAWIAFSDRLVAQLSSDAAVHDALQTAKGSFYVLVTAALLFALIRRSERRVRALGAEVRATVDSMADGVLLVDERSRIVEANAAAIALLGAPSKEEILGPLADWGRRFQVRSLDGAPFPADHDAVVRALEKEPVAQFGAIVRRLDGRDVFVSVAASRVARPGRPPLAVAVLRDVSAARRLDEMREEFLATAAHEFKTPLAVIKAYAQLMARREPAEQRALAVIQRQVERLTRLVQHLLDSSRLRLEHGAGRAEPFDLAILAREVADRMRQSAPDHALEVHADGPVPVRADRDRIERVITALVDNAVRFSPGGGPIRMRVGAADGEARISVADRGVGIPAERQAQLFQRYYRAHAGTPQDYGGLGLGLEMAREVVERHGGRMWFESAPGAGSTFHFGLPLPREGA